MPPQEQLKKILETHKTLTEGMATTKDVASLIKSVLDAVRKVKDKIDQDIADNRGEISQIQKSVLDKIQVLEVRMAKVSDNIEQKRAVDKKDIQKQLQDEVNKIRELIPQIPSFQPLEDRIAEVERKIPPQTDLSEIDTNIADIEDEIKDVKKDIDELKKRPIGKGGGGTSAMGVAYAFKHIAHTEEPSGVIDGVNTEYTVKNSIFWIAGFTLNGEQIAELPNFTYAGRKITFSSAIPASFSEKDWEIKYIGT